MRTSLSAFAICAAMLCPTISQAQTTLLHKSVELTVSVGLGQLRVAYPNSDVIAPPFGNAIALSAMAGYPINATLRLAAEGTYATASPLSVNRRMVSAGLVGSWQPISNAGFRIEAGPAYIWFREGLESSTSVATANAVAVRLGLAYEVPLGSRFLVMPYIRALLPATAESEFEGEAGTDVSTRLIQGGLSIGFH